MLRSLWGGGLTRRIVMNVYVVAGAGIFMAWITTALATQTGAPQPPAAPEAIKIQPGQVLSVTGCVGLRDQTGSQFTLSELPRNGQGGTAYLVSDPIVRPYVGRRVKIVGGLVPSPNVAAQAGALDPSRAAVASAPGAVSAAGRMQLPELRVTRVRPLRGSCRQ